MSNTPQLGVPLLSVLTELAETREKDKIWAPAVAALMRFTNASMGQLESAHPEGIRALVGLPEPHTGTALPPGAHSVRRFDLRAGGRRMGRMALYFADGQTLNGAAEPLLQLSCGMFALALEAESKAEEMETFVHGAAHDLRGAVVRATNFAQLLAAVPDLSDDNREIAGHLVASFSSLDPLIRDLVSYVAIGNLPEPSALPLSAVFDAVRWNTSRMVISRDATLSFDGHHLYVCAHEANLADLLQRLIDNSLKFGSEKPAVKISATSEGDQVLLSVKDNGPGIEARYREQVFKPFERLHGKRIPGHGLGLSICQKYVHSLGGQIGLDNGGGLTVLMRIPAETRAPALQKD